MSMFDIFEQVTEKNVIKSETGDARIFGVMVGIVAKNYEEGIKGRVCVHIPTRDDQDNEIRWAKVAMPSSGGKWGHYFLPEVGDQVLLAFEGGNIERPYVIGCIPKSDDAFIANSAKKDNNIKSITTRTGSKIEIDDGAGDGQSKKNGAMTFEMISDTQVHKIVMNNERGFILISDKSGNNFVRLDTGKDSGSGNGKITIKSEANITFETGGTSIVMNGKSNSVKIKADSFTFEANNNASIKASSLKIEGNNLSMDGQNVKVNGSFTQVSGQTVKLG